MSLGDRMPGWPALRGLRWSDEQARSYYDAGYWEPLGMLDHFARHAARTPDKVAFGDGATELTFAELVDRTTSLGGSLLDAGLEPGDIVLVRLHNSVDYVVALIGLAAAGLVAYHVAADTNSPGLISGIRRTEARAAIVEQPLAAEEREPLSAPALVITTDVDGEATLPFADLFGAPRTDLPPQDPDAVANLIPTSGTTGTPKLVMRSVNCSLAMARSLTERGMLSGDDTLLIGAPLSGGVGFFNGIGVGALTGCTTIVAPDLKPESMLALAARTRATRIATLPTVVTRMATSEALGEVDLSALRGVQTGGAFLRPEMGLKIERDLGCKLTIIFGSVDVGSVTMTSFEEPDPERRFGTVGKLLSGAEGAVVDPAGNPLPPGEVGEIVMRGPDTAFGYFDDPEATAKVFDDAGWGHFGDLAVFDDAGNARIVGRLKEIINRGGRKISVLEVETAVGEWDLIRDVAAVGYPDDDLGERCAVFVVTQDGSEVDLAQLRLHLEAHGTGKWMWPERIVCVDALPVSQSGKVKRDELRARLVAG
jgi:non-ribosomal peptide synthetase component E (peptide arylation enzyme)